VTWLLDANVFITAARREYGLEFCPAFWDWLIQANGAGKVYSLERVRSELVPGDDVGNWADACPEGFFLPFEPTDASSLSAVAAWARSGGFAAAAANEFLSLPDSQLVAVAHARKLTVVTHEVPSSSIKRIKIPTACVALGVKYASPYEMLRQEKARFILGKAA